MKTWVEEKFRNLKEGNHDKSLSNKLKNNEDEIEELLNTVSFSEIYDKLIIGKTYLQIWIAEKNERTLSPKFKDNFRNFKQRKKYVLKGLLNHGVWFS